MSRRQFLSTGLRGVAGAAVGWSLLDAIASSKGARAMDRPNVLFIAIDDLNDWVGCLGGHPDVKTPNLDRLAGSGVNFTQAYCAAPACNPSRAALMTGIRPHNSGIYINPQPWRKSPVLKDAVTLPQHLMAHGYKAIGGGKIYHGRYLDPASWNEYFPALDQSRPDDPLPPNRPVNGIPKTAHFDWGPVKVSDDEMGDMKVANWAAGQLQKKHDKPLFLACGIFRPHLPWYAPEKYFDMYPLDKITLPNIKEDDLDDVPPPGVKMARPDGDHKNVRDHKQWRQAVQGYLASITFADAAVGRVLDALDASPMKNDTAVVLWSDHGWHLGEKLHWRKFALWEEATHNVCMMRAPGITTPGTRCVHPIDMMDIYPTVADLCGTPSRKELDGKSLVPWLRDPDVPTGAPAMTTHGRGNHSLRTLRWRYIRYADGSEELYDHDHDEMEWTNLAGKPETKELREHFARLLPEEEAPESERDN
jgi:arylsulfatase A-like enzyme